MKMQRSTVIAGAVAGAVVFTSVLMAGGDRDKAPRPREVTITGKIVDLQSFMTGKFESSDHVACTQRCIQSGVPVALETQDGLIIIGEGTKGPARTIAPLAFQYAELKGNLYDHLGIKYIDVASAKAAKDPGLEEEVEESWETDPGWDEEDPDHSYSEEVDH